MRMRTIECQHDSRHGNAGITLIELVLVIAIIGILAAIAVFGYSSVRRTALNSQAIADVKTVSMEISKFQATNLKFPNSLADLSAPVPLDPWGRPYQYLNIADNPAVSKGKCRRDKKMNPLNSDFDLYSMGEDGQTATQLTAKASRDDLVRANDGGFVGLGADH